MIVLVSNVSEKLAVSWSKQHTLRTFPIRKKVVSQSRNRTLYKHFSTIKEDERLKKKIERFYIAT